MVEPVQEPPEGVIGEVVEVHGFAEEQLEILALEELAYAIQRVAAGQSVLHQRQGERTRVHLGLTVDQPIDGAHQVDAIGEGLDDGQMVDLPATDGEQVCQIGQIGGCVALHSSSANLRARSYHVAAKMSRKKWRRKFRPAARRTCGK